jgi:hypothetical protein
LINGLQEPRVSTPIKSVNSRRMHILNFPV